ncbi:sodium:solute symporter family protein [Ornithinimicrobium cavernae]|uniref:sodium:solute symporter family protein n=1 Tax=Ornithinimicrobium cavernae TaxID=2666047 RepID=UPI000D69DAED|nr:sodium:solute symporter family protein [Ornithinimicrobium cavernae]
MSVAAYGWTFLAIFAAFMVWIGLKGMTRTVTSDDYATARGSYAGWALGLSYMAVVASGSTFMGIPGLAYEYGFKAGYYPMLYPIGIYIGTMVIARRLKRAGDRFSSQTVPDFLGDLYRSRWLRVIAALVSIFLIYYLMSQFAASGQMFDVILGVPYRWGVVLAVVLVIAYMITGGAHADIITDAVQGLFMLAIAVFIVACFVAGVGVAGAGPSAVNGALPAEMRWDVHTDPSVPTFSSWWVLVLLLIAHLGFVTLPHLGNKFFALRGGGQVRQFVILSSVTGLVVGFLFLGGILGRAMGIETDSPDAIIPLMFLELLPPWGAAALAIAVLSAIISTADGLLMSISQIFANDLYRKTWVPMRGGDPNSPEVDRRALLIGRVGILVTGVVAALAVFEPPKLLAILLWVGIGGIISALTGPMFVGLFWKGATPFGAITAAVAAFGLYFAIHLGPQFGFYAGVYPWNENPFASTGVASMLGVLLTIVLSPLGKAMPAEHVDGVHANETEQEWRGTSDRQVPVLSREARTDPA